MFRTEIEHILPESNRMSIAAILRITPEHQELIADPVLLKKWGAALLPLAALRDYLQTHFQPPRRAGDLPEEKENSEETETKK